MLTPRVLNRTLLERQQLLDRVVVPPLRMVEHLVGLQAQEPLPPYLSLAARIDGFDPESLSETLAGRTAVRVLLMRGTIHLVTPADALGLRPFMQPMLDKVAANSATSKPAADVPRDELATAGRAAFAGGPVTFKALGETLAKSFPDVPSGALANRLREMAPLVQVPPRGLWKQPGGVVYQMLETWVGAPLPEPDPVAVVRRYLAAFGPSTPADVTAWSGVTGMRAIFDRMRDGLTVLRDVDGRQLFDLDGLQSADPDLPAPVRLLGRYDNLWLSHAGRDRVTTRGNRKRWMGVNGGVGNTVFVDGMLEGLWRQTASGRLEVELFRALTRTERSELDEETGRVEILLAR